MRLFNVFTALLLAGFAMPFLWQFIKLKVLHVAGNLALLATLVIDIALAALVLWWFSALSLGNFIGAAVIIFVVSRTTYDHIVSKLFSGRAGSAP